MYECTRTGVHTHTYANTESECCTHLCILYSGLLFEEENLHELSHSELLRGKIFRTVRSTYWKVEYNFHELSICKFMKIFSLNNAVATHSCIHTYRHTHTRARTHTHAHTWFSREHVSMSSAILCQYARLNVYQSVFIKLPD